MDLQFHGTEDQLEQYALGRLPDSELPVFEEHLLVCAACQERLEEVDSFTQGMRLALHSGVAEDSVHDDAAQTNRWVKPGDSLWSKPSLWFDGFRGLRLAFAVTGLTLVLVAGFVFSRGDRNLTPVAAFQLTALRGEMPIVAAAKQLDITLVDAPDPGGPWRVEMADGSGDIAWTGKTQPAPKGARVQILRHISPGDYFLRLYAADGSMLHEYGFRVKE